MLNLVRTTFGALLFLAAVSVSFAADPAPTAPTAATADADVSKPKTPAEPPLDMATLEAKFAKTMSGATLVGYFTTGAPDEKPREEKYGIAKVTKAKGDNWIFNARIQFGGKDVTVPLLIPVKWAGDTPVISVTNMGVPGLGTYTARVMVYNDHYAGTWSGKDHGGHLWGKIEQAGDDTAGDDGAAKPKVPSEK